MLIDCLLALPPALRRAERGLVEGEVNRQTAVAAPVVSAAVLGHGQVSVELAAAAPVVFAVLGLGQVSVEQALQLAAGSLFFPVLPEQICLPLDVLRLVREQSQASIGPRVVAALVLEPYWVPTW